MSCCVCVPVRPAGGCRRISQCRDRPAPEVARPPLCDSVPVRPAVGVAKKIHSGTRRGVMWRVCDRELTFEVVGAFWLFPRLGKWCDTQTKTVLRAARSSCAGRGIYSRTADPGADHASTLINCRLCTATLSARLLFHPRERRCHGGRRPRRRQRYRANRPPPAQIGRGALGARAANRHAAAVAGMKGAAVAVVPHGRHAGQHSTTATTKGALVARLHGGCAGRGRGRGHRGHVLRGLCGRCTPLDHRPILGCRRRRCGGGAGAARDVE